MCECTAHFCHEDWISTHICAHPFLAENGSTCQKCLRAYCRKCETSCGLCTQILCRICDCCDKCQFVVCERCSSKCECVRCHKIICSDAPCGVDLFVCSVCSVSICDSCTEEEDLFFCDLAQCSIRLCQPCSIISGQRPEECSVCRSLSCGRLCPGLSECTLVHCALCDDSHCPRCAEYHREYACANGENTNNQK